MDKLLGIICTEAVEDIESSRRQEGSRPEQALPPIDYRLELIEGKDGCLYWME